MSDSFVAGCVSGCLVRACTCPLDVLKVRFQLQLEPIHQSALSSKYRGLLDAVRTVLKEEGVSAFWKGHVAGQLLYIVYGGVQFFTFDTCQRMLTEHFPNIAKWKRSSKFVSGTVAGATACAASHPFDVIRTRFIGQGEPKIYPNIPKAVLMMYRENGIHCFYRGLVPSLLYIAPQAGLSFGFYHFLVLLWSHMLGPQHGPQSMRSLICGAVAGIGSKTIILPLDMVKKRLEVQGFEEARIKFGKVTHYSGPIDCFKKVVRHEGVKGFYKGTSPAILKAAASVSLSFMFYERALHWLQTRHMEN